MIQEIRPDHNTYLISGISEKALERVAPAIEVSLGIALRGNPDYWYGAYVQFTIDESRAMKELPSKKPFGEKRVLVVEALAITTDAQQAMLKLAEDLAAHTYLFLLLPTSEQLLPTLRSRFVEIRMENAEDGHSAAEEFLASPWEGRLKTIERITKNKDAKGAYALLSSIEAVLARDTIRHADVLERVILAKRRVLQSIVPLKFVIESAALELPLLH